MLSAVIARKARDHAVEGPRARKQPYDPQMEFSPGNIAISERIFCILPTPASV